MHRAKAGKGARRQAISLPGPLGTMYFELFASVFAPFAVLRIVALRLGRREMLRYSIIVRQRHGDLPSRQICREETGRLEAFSDGVFGIAMTLRVLELRVPPPWRRGRDVRLSRAGRWLRHSPGVGRGVLCVRHELLHDSRHVGASPHIVPPGPAADGRLLFANGLLLMLVTAVAVPDGGHRPSTSSRQPPKPRGAVYGGVSCSSLSLSQLLQRSAFRPGIVSPGRPPSTSSAVPPER